MKKEEILKKLTSRKFIISLAAFLGSIAVSISGIATSDHTITTIGVVCGILSAAFYSAAEAYVDAKAVNAREDEDESTNNA